MLSNCGSGEVSWESLGQHWPRSNQSILREISPEYSLEGLMLKLKLHIVKAMVFPVVMYEYESWTIKKAEPWRNNTFELWYWRRLLRVPWTARKSILNIHWRDWCWSWNANSLATWCKELTRLKRPWCWERLEVGGEGDERGWDGWMASLTQWTWVWVNSGSWWWTGRPGVLRFMGSQRVRHDWVTDLMWSVPY